MEPKLSNIHEALRRAQVSERDRVALVNANFKVHPIKKQVGEQICNQSGTTLSSFLRECINLLVEDYAGEKAANDLEK